MIHIMDGSFAAGEGVFLDPTTQRSAHYGISKAGVIHQYVHEHHTAFHAGIVVNASWALLKPNVNPNFYTMGIEHEGLADDTWTKEQLSASAELVGQIAARWEIPLDPLHVIRHQQIRASKTCPGNWLRDTATLLALVPHSTSPTPTPTATVRTLSAVNLRAAPNTRAPIVQVIPVLTDVAVNGFVAGERVNANACWYADGDGNYLWAGATDRPTPTAKPMPLTFVGRSRALSRDGLASATQSLSVQVPEISSVMAVETSGCGFLPDRRPKILFERHIFHRLTNGQFDDHADISNPQPGGYGPGGANQYDRLGRAITLDREAALQSASWGSGQVMGENFAAAGFADVDAMVGAMCDSEDAQLTAVAAFLKTKGLARALRNHDWSSFARGYNGPNFAQNRYDVKLKAAFQMYSSGAMPDLDIRAAQLYLSFCGFDPGSVDGFMGSRTRAALVDFQTQQQLPTTGQVDGTVLARLVQVALA